MKNAPPARILLSGSATTLDEITRLLREDGHIVVCQSFEQPIPDDLLGHHLAIVEATGDSADGLRWCRRLRDRMVETPLPVLFILDDPAPSARLASYEAGAEGYLLRPFAPAELRAQVRAFLRFRRAHDRLAEKSSEVQRINKRLQQAYQQIDQELELARQLQISFLPHALPEVPQAQFAVHYLMCGQVGGDFYDVFRLDEEHVGFYVADAMGHGVPASLLTIFIKKGVRGKEVFGNQYRLIAPGEVLQRLNRDLIDLALSETPFITLVYVLLNHRSGQIRFSRAGHPYPLHIPREGPLQIWQNEGLVLGVFEAQFAEQTHQLQSGDRLLLYSDGIDAGRFEEHEPGLPSLQACVERHRRCPLSELLKTLARELFPAGHPPDDLTLLALEMTPTSAE